MASLLFSWEQCDQNGRFLKVLGNKFAFKSSPKSFVYFWAIWKKIICHKNCCGYYLGNFWKHLGNFFNPASGHTGWDRMGGVQHLLNLLRKKFHVFTEMRSFADNLLPQTFSLCAASADKYLERKKSFFNKKSFVLAQQQKPVWQIYYPHCRWSSQEDNREPIR